MSTPVFTAKSEQALEEVAHHFKAVSTLPVVDGNLRCIGVISKKDQAKASHGVRSSSLSLSLSLSLSIYLSHTHTICMLTEQTLYGLLAVTNKDR
jgi:CBS-domain-containing membrane protein